MKLNSCYVSAAVDDHAVVVDVVVDVVAAKCSAVFVVVVAADVDADDDVDTYDKQDTVDEVPAHVVPVSSSHHLHARLRRRPVSVLFRPVGCYPCRPRIGRLALRNWI